MIVVNLSDSYGDFVKWSIMKYCFYDRIKIIF